MTQVTVIIPNYNGLHFLETCLQALRRQTYAFFETLMIDNASTDGSVEYVREHFPEVKIAVMEENLGFAGGVNAGIRMADTPYVLLLNNDTEVTETFVEALVHCAEKSPRIFSVSSKMLQFIRRDRIDDAGDLYNVLGWGFQRGIDHSAKKYRRQVQVFSACAGAALYRKSILDEIGLFDEMHFAYLEDIDLGYRARIYGYQNVYCPNAVVYHVGSGTSGSKYNAFKVRLAARNNLYLLAKNMPMWQQLLNALPLYTGMWLKKRFFKKIGFEEAYNEGLEEGWRTLHLCRKVTAQGKVGTYWKIQLELWWNLWIYTVQFLERKLKKAK